LDAVAGDDPMTTPRRAPIAAYLAWGLSIACGPVVARDVGDSSTEGAPSTTVATIAATSIDAVTSPTPPPPELTDAVATTVHAETSAGSSTGAGETCDFICDDDGTYETGRCLDCDLWTDECCADDQKCMPWANDGGNRWTSVRCAPVDDAPAGLGEPCEVQGSYVSSIDSCGDRLMCFWVDPRGDVGTCVAKCEGSENAPSCSDPGTSCVIDFDATLALCLPPCDPLVPDCVHGSCVRVDGADGPSFACGVALLPSVDDFAPCEHDWSCAPGSLCVDGDLPPACEDDDCCAPICDLAAPDACGPDRVCTSLLPERDATPDWRVGYCALP
jgi:hypothetical protein